MERAKLHATLALTLVLSVFLWGATNTGTKYIVTAWPPIWTGGSRMFCAGLLLLLVLRWTRTTAVPASANRITIYPPHQVEAKGDSAIRSMKSDLWLRGGLSLACYIIAFNWALRFTSPSHVALYLGCSPIWALLWERKSRRLGVKSYVAAFLALGGLFILFFPALNQGKANWIGELLGLAASVLWTHYGRQCRQLALSNLSGAEVSAHTMWRAGVLLLAVSLIELPHSHLIWRSTLVWVQIYCIIGGGVVTFALWNNALKYWPASQVLLFNNLIPLSTMGWSWAILHEPVTRTYWFAMLLVISGVLLGQWKKN